MSSKDSKKKAPPPSFSGSGMMNVQPSMGIDNGGDESNRSRRVAFQPSFEPMSSFQPPAPQETQFSTFSKPSLSETKSATPAAKVPVSSSSKSFVWELKQVAPLPEFHPLERTAVFVPHAAPSEVSKRISQVLRERSIEAFYEDEKAKVKCITADSVDFRVRLYRGRGRFDHGIIVEVQRRFGASNTFHNDTTAILDAAQGKVPPPPMSSSNLPLVSDAEDDYQPTDGSSSLLMVSKMFSHPGYDAHYLALQTLASLTDASKMGPATARAVSKDLLRLENDNDVAAKVLSLVIDKQGDDDMFKLRSMALQVAANAFQSLSGNVPNMLKEQLRSVLVQELRQAEQSPRTALQAARIVEFLVPQDTGSDLHSALEKALEAGTARHAALQRQAQICLDKLQ